jgi:hypothetical protein
MKGQLMETPENELIPTVYAEEVGELIWSKLIEWLNGENKAITPEIREFFIDHSIELRLRMQAVFIEVQRRFLNQVAAEAEFEDHLRRDIRSDLPYMSSKEKLEALKTLQSTTDVRMSRLESQLAGFDFFNTIQVSVQSMTDTKVSKDLAASVKRIPSARRQNLLAMLNEMVKKIEEPPPLEATTVEVINDTTTDPK